MTTPSSRPTMADLSPHFVGITQNVLFGDVWEQPNLSKRDRSLITVAALTALYRTDQLKGHMQRALDNGVTREEIIAVVEHMAFYAGWPSAANGFNIAAEVLPPK